MLTIEQLMCIAIQLTAAISYLHRNNVIHGDIATRNCLLVRHFHLSVNAHVLMYPAYPGRICLFCSLFWRPM